jgi:hypothetical protein
VTQARFRTGEVHWYQELMGFLLLRFGSVGLE